MTRQWRGEGGEDSHTRKARHEMHIWIRNRGIGMGEDKIVTLLRQGNAHLNKEQENYFRESYFL